jgi:hypothetical protein
MNPGNNCQFLTDTSYENMRVRPFIRSTLIMDDYRLVKKNGTISSLHLITRDMKYMAYNLSTYFHNGLIEKTIEIQINDTSLKKAECRDLDFDKRIGPLRERFTFFCRHMGYAKDRFGLMRLENIMTLVTINKT